VPSSRTRARRRPAGIGLLIAGLITVTVSTTAAPAAWASPVAAVPVVAAAESTLADPTFRATDEDKVAATRVLGINPGIDMLVLNDQEFVLALWREAKPDTFVKAEALRAYDTTDSDAAYAFITTGIFVAAADDARAEIAAAHAKALRRSVAVTVGLDPADTALIEQSDRDFIFSVFQRVARGSFVWIAADKAIALGTTAEDWTQFLTVDAQIAAEQDMRKAIAEANAELAAELAAKQLATAKRSLLQLLLLPVTEELVSAPNRQYVLHVHANAKGTEVKLASQAAINTADAELEKALRDFIFTGGAAANVLDEKAAAEKELAGYRTTTTAIRDAAKTDGYQPNLVAAANQALAGNTLLILQTFLLKGQEDARKLDEQFRAKATRDFDGDAKPDVITVHATTGELLLYRGTGAGRFESGRRVIGTGWNNFTAVFSPGDFNGDTFNDLIVRNTAGELRLYRGNGKGGWLNGTASDLIGTGWAKFTAIFSPGDFNGDGFSDVIVRNAAGELRLYRGNGKGSWIDPSSNILIGTGWNNFTAIFSPGDFNGDRFSDVIVRNAAGEMRLYRGNGKGSWIDPSSNILIGTGWNSFTAIFSPGDWNSDGRADVIVRNAAGELRLYRGNGKGSWIDPSSNILIGTGWNSFEYIF
jgi:hypothetical protein